MSKQGAMVLSMMNSEPEALEAFDLMDKGNKVIYVNGIPTHPEELALMESTSACDIISYPPCKKGIRPGICVKPAVSHEAGGRVRYGWLNADTRPYPFFTRG